MKNFVQEFAEKIAEILQCPVDNVNFEHLREVHDPSIKGRYATKKEWLPIDMDYVKVDTSCKEFRVRLGADTDNLMNAILLAESNKLVTTFKLYQMPHCCAILISCNVSVYGSYQKKGIGKTMNLFRIELGRQLGYSCMMCTDIEQNTAQRKILHNNGWKDVHNVINRRTKNNVFISVINI